MKAAGFGGRGDVSRNEERVLSGVLTTDRQEQKMIDQAQRVTGVVRDELAAQAVSHGVPKTEIGYSVTQTFAPMPAANGQVGVFLCWLVTVTLRLALLGHEPAVFPVLIPGAMADDRAFRESARQALEETIKMRDDVMRQIPAAQL